MMRLSREEEHCVGRARPAIHARIKVGFAKDGRITAVDMFTVVEGGPYGPGGDGNSASRYASLMFQPESMRWRGMTAITNTPPRGAQSQPGGMQGITLMEPILAKAARKLGVDQVEIRKINAPEGKAQIRTAQRGRQSHVHDELLPEGSARQGRELEFGWDERKARSGQRNGSKGARRRRGRQRRSSAAPPDSTGCSSSSPTARCISRPASATSAPSR